MNTRRRPIAPSPNIYATNAKICHLVAQHPCLYDRSDENYMRKSTVINAWKDISKDMRISGGFIIPACMVGIDKKNLYFIFTRISFRAQFLQNLVRVLLYNVYNYNL